MKKTAYFLLMLLPLFITLFALPFLPETVPAHYDFVGEVDRWGSKYETLIFPAVTILMGVFMLFMAKVAAKEKEGGEKNEKIVFYTGMGISVWFTIMHCYNLYMDFTLAQDLYDKDVDINQLFCIVMGIGMVIVGNFMPKLRNNSVMGLRTVWSMKNDTVWKKCQLFGGVSFMTGGALITLSGFVFKGLTAMFIALGIIISCAVAGIIYSYFAAKKYE